MGIAPIAVTRSPLLARFVLFGAGWAGLVGGVIGLVIGLRVHPASAWFAVFELGVPAATIGALLGLAAGLIVMGIRQLCRA